jgi:cytochrome c oxidase subunit 2
MIRARPWCSLLGGSLLLGGCASDVQSVLTARSLQAGQIAELAWLLFGVGALVLTLVIVAVWLAVGGPSQIRRALAQESTVVWLGIAFPAVTLSVLLAYGVWVMRSHLNLPHDRSTLSIEVAGEQWWWRVTYSGPNGTPIASANEIRIPVGFPVTFKLKAADVIHSFWVPSLGGKVDMIPSAFFRPPAWRWRCQVAFRSLHGSRQSRRAAYGGQRRHCSCWASSSFLVSAVSPA